jgi:RHS repeat-associated protein
LFYYNPNQQVIAEHEGTTPQLTKEYVYGNNVNEILAMFFPQDDVGQEDFEQFLAFCAAWLSESGDANYDDSLDVVDDSRIDFKDFAVFASQWGSFPPDIESHYYYLTDALGSVRGLIGGKFNREEDREFYNYDVYGTSSEASTIGNPFMFAGYYLDAETGLYYLVNRTYDSYTGRFLQMDEDYYDGMNLYEYAYSNPTMFVDPWGLYGDKWYEKAWENAKHIGMYIGIGVWELPGQYVETGVSGEQCSALCGYSDNLTDSLNPFGGGTTLGPAYGQTEAYSSGQQVGSGAGFVMNATMTVAGVQGTIVGITQLATTGGGLLQIGRLMTSTGTIIPVVMQNGQAVAATAETLSAMSVAAYGSKNMVDERAKKCKCKCQKTNNTEKPKTNNINNEPPQLSRGKKAHKEEPVLPGEKAEVHTPSGKRMDRYNEDTAHIREIKPNNPRQKNQGQKQVDAYRKEMEKVTGRPHTGEVTPYDPSKY